MYLGEYSDGTNTYIIIACGPTNSQLPSYTTESRSDSGFITELWLVKANAVWSFIFFFYKLRLASSPQALKDQSIELGPDLQNVLR